MSEVHLSELHEARRRARRIRRAGAYAKFSGITMALFALVSLVMGLFGDWASLAIGVVLGAIAFNELKGAELLERFDVRAAVRLGYGQVVLGFVIVAYAAWSWYAQSKASPLAAYGGSTGSAEVDAMYLDIVKSVSPMLSMFWGAVAMVGLAVSLVTARYYFSRDKLVREMRTSTPAWILEVIGEGEARPRGRRRG